MELLNALAHCLSGGFQITILFLCILKLIFKNKSVLWQHLFQLSNYILLAASIIFGVIFIVDLISELSDSGFRRTAYVWRVMGPYWYSYWIIAASHFIIPQILWFKRFRNSYRTSIVMMLVLFIFGPLTDRFIIYATSSYIDYLPSGWTYYAPRPMEILVTFLFFCFILMVLYFICRKRLQKVADGQTL